MRPRVTALLVFAALCFGVAPPAAATDVDGPDDCVRAPVDFGDAPENMPAYPGVTGFFPTCTAPSPPGTQEIAAGCQVLSSPPGPTGVVIHLNDIGGYWLGCIPQVPMGIDSDNNGKVSLGLGGSVCDGSPVDCMEAAFGLSFGQDECFGGNDAGLVAWSFRACSPATITFSTFNCRPDREVFLNVLLDMNQDGDWNDSFMCPDGTCAYEWALANVPLLLPPGCTT